MNNTAPDLLKVSALTSVGRIIFDAQDFFSKSYTITLLVIAHATLSARETR